MKRFITVFTLVTILISCKDDSSTPTPQSGSSGSGSGSTSFPSSLQPLVGKWYPGAVVQTSGLGIYDDGVILLDFDPLKYREYTSNASQIYPGKWTMYQMDCEKSNGPLTSFYGTTSSLGFNRYVIGDTLFYEDGPRMIKWFKFQNPLQNSNVEWEYVLDAPYPVSNDWYIIIKRWGFPNDSIPIVSGQTTYSGVSTILPSIPSCGTLSQYTTLFEIYLFKVNNNSSNTISYTGTIKYFNERITAGQQNIISSSLPEDILSIKYFSGYFGDAYE